MVNIEEADSSWQKTFRSDQGGKVRSQAENEYQLSHISLDPVLLWQQQNDVGKELFRKRVARQCREKITKAPWL
jgi:hypothetical protein